MTSADVRALFRRLRDAFETEEAHLAELDAKVGDGDHGAAHLRGGAVPGGDGEGEGFTQRELGGGVEVHDLGRLRCR